MPSIKKNNDYIFSFSFNNSYKQLKEKNIININIIKSKISLYNYSQSYRCLNKNDISLINEIHKKYQKYSEPLFKDEDNTIPQPLLNTNSVKGFSATQTNQNLSTLFNDILLKQKEISFIHNLNKNIFFEYFSQKKDNLPFLYNIRNDGDFSNNKLENKRILLNNKRMRNISKKFHKKTMVIITKDKNKIDNNEYINNNNMDIKEEEIDKDNKKVIFLLSKEEKMNESNYPKDLIINKIKKVPGRKKKNSEEKGTHDKFSKDNMMRKLKNKVMESARKLINKMIKIEAGKEFRNFQELRKIEGIYSQELNIKFNFWFYFQKIKDIFQFKMSSKYSRGDSHSNNELIRRIYSEEKRHLFSRTIRLFELEFHQYYHYIFLGEEKNWCSFFGIKENKYQLEYFLNEKNEKNENLKNDNEEIKYKKTINELALKYELFFLKKNPRLSGIKKKEEKEESNYKKMIKNINNEQFITYRYKFIMAGIKYIHELKNYYKPYIDENKNHFLQYILPSLFLNSNRYISNNNNKTGKKVDSQNNTEINKTNNNNILFDVSKSKKLIFEIKKDRNKNLKENNIKSSSKNNNNENNNNESNNNENNNNENNNNVQTKQITPNKSVINSTKDDDSRQKIERETKNKFII